MTELDDKDIAAMAAALGRALSDHWDAAAGCDPGLLWRVYADLGIADLIGDLGQPVRVLAAMLRVTGRHLAPGPLIEEAFVRPWLAARLGSGILDVTGPDDRLALVDPAETGDWRPVRGEVRLDAGVLTGSVRAVAHAPGSSTLVVLARENGGERLVVVAAGAAGVRVAAADGLDPGCPIGSVEFRNCRVADAPSVDVGTIGALRAWLRVLTAAELCGIAEAVIEMTRRHAMQREQFGRPIAGFQAVRHILADMAMHSIALGNLIELTAHDLEELADDDRDEAAAVAKAYAASASLRICEQGLQLHGGIGFVEEHPLHRYFKAMLRRYAHYGTPGELHAEIGARLAIPS